MVCNRLLMEVKNMYLAKFDEKGNRTTTLLACEYTEEQKSQMYAAGYVDLSEEDWSYYVGNHGMGDNGTGYIRDKATGKPVSAPPAPKPSKAQRIAQLEKDFESARFTIGTYYMEAVLDGNKEVQEELQHELVALKAQYDEDVANVED